MPQVVIAGPGQGLPPAQSLYPGNLLIGSPNPYTPSGNSVDLAAGAALPIPAGTWIVAPGPYSVLQWLDPITGIWRGHSSARTPFQVVQSDGFTRRVANLTGCPVAAVVTTVGATYVQSATTVTVNTGNSTWQPIIGGLVTLTTISTAGAHYTIPPLVIMPPCPPPSGGVPQGVAATAVAAISSGTVSTITVTNQGAGYPAAFTVTLLPDPTDPNIATITNAVAVFGITGAGTVAAVLCTNPGSPTASAPTLTISGGDSNAKATAVWMNTVLTETITAAGAGYQNNGLITTTGGVTAATAVNTNPAVELTGYIPRQLQGAVATGGTLNTITSVATVYDSGLFTGTPVGVVVGGAVTTIASITFGLGGKPDSVTMQPV